MRDTNLPNPDGSRSLPSPPKVFPDLATCRVKPSSLDGYFDCLSIWSSYCPHHLIFQSNRLCRHSTAAAMFARSEAEKDKPA